MNSDTSKRILLTLTVAGLLASGVALAASDAAPSGKADGDGREHHHEKHGRGARGPDGMRMGGPGEMLLGRMGDELQLSDEQRTRIRGIVDASRPEMDALRDEMRTVGARIADADPDDKGYAGAVSQSARRMGELTTQMIERSSAVRAQVHAVLTPAQKAQAAKLKERMQQRWEERRQSRDARRGPPELDDGPPPPAPPADGGN